MFLSVRTREREKEKREEKKETPLVICSVFMGQRREGKGEQAPRNAFLLTAV